MEKLTPPNDWTPPSGICECGCGRRTSIAIGSRPRRGVYCGYPRRFICGHGGRGTSRSLETRAKMAVSSTGRTHSPETRAKLSRVLAGKKHPHTPESRAKISAANRGQTRSNETKAKLSDLRRRYWATLSPEDRQRAIEQNVAVLRTRCRPTTIENTVAQWLNAQGIEFATEQRIDRYYVDVLVPSRHLIIECDGVYWHSRPGAAEVDALRDVRMTELGYSVLRLPEHSIRDGSFTTTLSGVLSHAGRT